MATEVKQPETVVTKSSEEKLVENTQQFWSKNSKLIVYGLAVVVLLVGGFFVYKSYFKAPAERAANEAIWPAQQAFRVDSFSRALNGDGTKSNPGFLKIARNHSGTKAGNLANFYSGVCYLQLGDFKNAIKFLEDFSTEQVELKLRKAGSLADAYSELGQNDKAADLYKQASTVFEKDEINSSEYLFRLGQLYDKMGKPKDAIATFKTLKEKFPTTTRGLEADKYLAKLGEVN